MAPLAEVGGSPDRVSDGTDVQRIGDPLALKSLPSRRLWNTGFSRTQGPMESPGDEVSG